MNRTIVAAVLAAPTLAGCYPMEQAPLVYASKSTIGVGLAAGTPENPGLDVTIGFKETNVALVPVAVAKFCRLPNQTNCQNAIYALHVIKGGKIDTVENRRIRKDIEERQAEISTLERSIGELERGRTTAEDNIRKLEKRAEAEKTLDTVGRTPTPDEGEVLANQRAAALLVWDGTASVSKTTLAAERNTLNQTTELLNAQKARVATLQGEIGRFAATLTADKQGTRDDALSVFGTFKGGGTGDNEGASLTGGKVFATGIAAQNLSEHAGVADCLSAVGLLADQFKASGTAEQIATAHAARNGLLASAGDVCKRDNTAHR